ncbi:hypothetical protein CRV01_03145 [Arcobacter sp. CECT 8983]|uniref:alpha/beta fold hydrolase n=1 Tax=Arcobacter sp. CECT 8983 TaxID=2044508 RepID=UPI00100B1BD6|nr:alpha/beta fold hydrolase [Arcobacter sp. CECT 8983]RXJ90172.1 hypothetical protein CRV01_03145 [Arcobacter sp. CECT 8983]
MAIKRYEYEKNYFLEYSDYNSSCSKTLVMLYGTFGTIKQDELAKFYEKKQTRLIVISRVGYGNSTYKELENYLEYANIIIKLLDSLQLKEFSLLGTSAGALHCYCLDTLISNRIKNIFVYSSMAAVNEEEVIKCYGNYEQIKRFYEFFAKQSNKQNGDFMFNFYNEIFDEEFKKSHRYKDTIANENKALGQEVKLQSKSWGFSIKDVKTKVYLHHAKDDREVPYQAVEQTAKILKNSSLKLVEKGGHNNKTSFFDFNEFLSSKL